MGGNGNVESCSRTSLITGPRSPCNVSAQCHNFCCNVSHGAWSYLLYIVPLSLPLSVSYFCFIVLLLYCLPVLWWNKSLYITIASAPRASFRFRPLRDMESAIFGMALSSTSKIYYHLFTELTLHRWATVVVQRVSNALLYLLSRQRVVVITIINSSCSFIYKVDNTQREHT